MPAPPCVVARPFLPTKDFARSIDFYSRLGWQVRFRDENLQLDRELSSAGVPHVFRVYPGGHEQAVWTKYAPAWLSLALDHLAKPQG